MDTDSLIEVYLNNVWRPCLSTIGCEIVPKIKGEATHDQIRQYPGMKMRFNMRLPPYAKPETIVKLLEKRVTEYVPNNAKVTFKNVESDTGWQMEPLLDWQEKILVETSASFFNHQTGFFSYGSKMPTNGRIEHV